MDKFQFSNKAKKDLKNIWNYTFDAWSEKQADKYYKEIIKLCRKIAKMPKIGKLYPNLARIEIRGIKVGKHIIFYFEIEDQINNVEIVRILHERMDLTKQINK